MGRARDKLLLINAPRPTEAPGARRGDADDGDGARALNAPSADHVVRAETAVAAPPPKAAATATAAAPTPRAPLGGRSASAAAPTPRAPMGASRTAGDALPPTMRRAAPLRQGAFDAWRAKRGATPGEDVDRPALDSVATTQPASAGPAPPRRAPPVASPAPAMAAEPREGTRGAAPAPDRPHATPHRPHAVAVVSHRPPHVVQSVAPSVDARSSWLRDRAEAKRLVDAGRGAEALGLLERLCAAPTSDPYPLLALADLVASTEPGRASELRARARRVAPWLG